MRLQKIFSALLAALVLTGCATLYGTTEDVDTLHKSATAMAKKYDGVSGSYRQMLKSLIRVTDPETATADRLGQALEQLAKEDAEMADLIFAHIQALNSLRNLSPAEKQDMMGDLFALIAELKK